MLSCAVDGGTTQREQAHDLLTCACQHLSAHGCRAAAAAIAKYGRRRWVGSERGRKGPVCEIFQVGNIVMFANDIKKEAAFSQALGQVGRQ